MANLVCSTAAHAHEALASAAVAPLFRAFLNTLPPLIADEADLVGLPEGDPAIIAWITTADASRAASLAAVEALVQAPASGVEEQALQRVGRVFLHAMLSDDPDVVAHIRAMLAVRRWRFRVSALLPGAQLCNAFIDAALDLFDRYLALDDGCDMDASDLGAVWPDDIEPNLVAA